MPNNGRLGISLTTVATLNDDTDATLAPDPLLTDIEGLNRWHAFVMIGGKAMVMNFDGCAGQFVAGTQAIAVFAGRRAPVKREIHQYSTASGLKSPAFHRFDDNQRQNSRLFRESLAI